MKTITTPDVVMAHVRRWKEREGIEGVCHECHDTGWTSDFSMFIFPHFTFERCRACHNPENHRCP